MKAVVWTKYGSPDGLQFKEVAKPVPRDNELLIRIHAATVTAGDTEIRSLKFPLWFTLPMRIYWGFLKPRGKILGQELSGEVEAVGKDVRLYKVGDSVVATTGFGFGGYAEYVCLPEKSESSILTIKPANMTYEEAAALPTGGLEALHFLRKANIQHGQKLLINGAGGSIGTFAVQLARYFGAEVTGVDSTAKMDMLRSLGADHVIDYTQEDFSKSGKTYDAVLDVVGRGTYSRCIRALKRNGRYLLANPRLISALRGLWTSMTSGKKIISGGGIQKTEDLLFLKELAESGKLVSVIDRRFPLEQTADAHRYVETGRKQGNVIIAVAAEPVGAP